MFKGKSFVKYLGRKKQFINNSNLITINNHLKMNNINILNTDFEQALKENINSNRNNKGKVKKVIISNCENNWSF